MFVPGAASVLLSSLPAYTLKRDRVDQMHPLFFSLQFYQYLYQDRQVHRLVAQNSFCHEDPILFIFLDMFYLIWLFVYLCVLICCALCQILVVSAFHVIFSSFLC